MAIAAQLQSDELIDELKAALILAGEPFLPDGYQVWQLLQIPGQIHHWLDPLWDYHKQGVDGNKIALQRVDEAFDEARPYAAQIKVLRAKIIARGLRGELPTYLNVRLDREKQTVARKGYTVQPIHLTNLEWQALKLLFDGGGRPVPSERFAKPHYTGKNGSALRNVLNALETKLIPLDLCGCGRRKLESVTRN